MRALKTEIDSTSGGSPTAYRHSSAPEGAATSLGGKDAAVKGGVIEEFDIEIERDINAGWDLIPTEAS